MNTLVRVHARDRRKETMAAVVCAGAAMIGLLLAAGAVVLFDLKGLTAQVESFFQVDLNPPEMPTAQTAYARDAARDLSERLLRGSDTGIFSQMPGQPDEMPNLQRLDPTPVAEIPLSSTDRLPEPAPTERSAFLDRERALAREVTRTALPVVAARAVGSGTRMPVPPLDKLHDVGRPGLGALGRPGQTLTLGDAPQMPDAPSALSLQAVPLASVFPRAENAAVVSRRLVDERPARGYPSLDDDIDAEFVVYREPGAAEAFFRLTLALKPQSSVPTIAKDVLFLIDISQSVGADELARIRSAVIGYLGALPAADRWNVVAFSEKTFYLNEEPFFQNAGAFDAARVADFIDKRRGQRRTDVFDATRVILGRIPAGNRPCNVFLVSDGNATEGISDVRRIVNDFQRVNRENFAVYTFDAGPGGNAYLLSLLAYRSRGRAIDCPDLDRAPAQLELFCRQYGRPVLTNVVANYTNIRTTDVYPEVLPNLYREAPIVFWGRTTPGREVALRVAGLTEAGPREFFFRAVVPEGDARQPEVVRGWARGKAHELIARLGDDPQNAPLRAEALDLAARYNLPEITRLLSGR